MAKEKSYGSYDNMTIPELESAKDKLEVQKEEIRDEQKRIVAMINRKVVEKKLDTMTDAERDAIKQIIGK